MANIALILSILFILFIYLYFYLEQLINFIYLFFLFYWTHLFYLSLLFYLPSIKFFQAIKLFMIVITWYIAYILKVFRSVNHDLYLSAIAKVHSLKIKFVLSMSFLRLKASILNICNFELLFLGVLIICVCFWYLL